TLTVYPNPASKSVTFGSNVPFETITISNVLGTHIAELRNTTTFDVSSLAPGTYVVSGQRGAQRIVTMMVKR
ncbi:MAG: T9SS type A sorting domain-containing protein, partial [Ignavibacteria bacterium]